MPTSTVAETAYSPGSLKRSLCRRELASGTMISVSEFFVIESKNPPFLLGRRPLGGASYMIYKNLYDKKDGL
jgi:hypothetical protein